MSTIFATGGTTFGTFFEDVIEGSEDFDQIFASFGNDVVNGYGGDDSLQGGGGDDTVDGGAGNDTVEGGVGNDLLFGGLGADTFLFKPFSAPGNDIIADFNPLEDKLVFDLPGDASKFANLDASVLTFEWVGNDRIITLENTDLHITLQNYAGGFDGPINITFI